MTPKKFQTIIWQHYRSSGRQLPWRENITPYAIVVSEIMLQQTQVDRVQKKYQNFLDLFPSFAALARAPLSEVLKTWQGLGYNRRALALHKLSQIVVREHGGQLPSSLEQLERLPGIGPATAGAISAFAWQKATPFIETNIRRVYIHFFFPHRTSIPDKDLMPLIEKTLDHQRPRQWYWALMDYGAMLAKKYPNPNLRSHAYRRQSPFHNSFRQLRGQALRTLLSQAPLTATRLGKELNQPLQKVTLLLAALERDGFVTKSGKMFMLRK